MKVERKKNVEWSSAQIILGLGRTVLVILHQAPLAFWCVLICLQFYLFIAFPLLKTDKKKKTHPLQAETTWRHWTGWFFTTCKTCASNILTGREKTEGFHKMHLSLSYPQVT